METNIRRSVNPEIHTAIFTIAPKNKKSKAMSIAHLVLMFTVLAH
jgi:hypothetical protein